MNIKYKLLIYKCLLKPVWTYSLQVRGLVNSSNINKIQAFQSKTLGKITKAPFYVSNCKYLNTLVSIVAAGE